MSRAPHPSSPDAAPAPQPSEDPMNREAPGQPEAGPQWRRVHPLTPLARFWITAVLILVLFLRPLIEDVITGETDAGDLVRGAEEMAGGVSLLAVLTVLAAVAVVIGAMALTWWFTRWAVTEDSVHVREGILLRKERQARLERVQAIEITQPLLARLLRLAELRFDVADAEDAALHLRFLSLRQAEDLRGRLLSRARQLRAPATPGSGVAASGNAAPENSAAQDSDSRDPRVVQARGGSIGPASGTVAAGGPDTGISEGGVPQSEAPEGLAEREVLRVPLARAAAAPLLSAGLLSSLLAILLIAVILVLANIANYSGGSTAMGTALAAAGPVFPLFAPVIGWIGVFLTGSVVNNNTLFGPLQVATAQGIGASPSLLVGTNTAGGTTAKVISPQSIAIATAAVDRSGQESRLMRLALPYSLGLLAYACLWVLALSLVL